MVLSDTLLPSFTNIIGAWRNSVFVSFAAILEFCVFLVSQKKRLPQMQHCLHYVVRLLLCLLEDLLHWRHFESQRFPDVLRYCADAENVHRLLRTIFRRNTLLTL